MVQEELLRLAKREKEAVSESLGAALQQERICAREDKQKVSHLVSTYGNNSSTSWNKICQRVFPPILMILALKKVLEYKVCCCACIQLNILIPPSPHSVYSPLIVHFFIAWTYFNICHLIPGIDMHWLRNSFNLCLICYLLSRGSRWWK